MPLTRPNCGPTRPDSTSGKGEYTLKSSVKKGIFDNNPNAEVSSLDDFANILEKVPGCYMFLSSGYPDKDVAPSHNPKVIFNEGVLPIGAAYLAHCATRWLENNI